MVHFCRRRGTARLSSAGTPATALHVVTVTFFATVAIRFPASREHTKGFLGGRMHIIGCGPPQIGISQG